MRSDKYLLWLYPRHWRERYEEEMLAMLELRPCSLLDSVNLILGALDAHLHPSLATTGLSLFERINQMLSLVRRSLLTLFCASLGFLLIGLGFQQMNEYDDFLKAAQAYSLVGFSYHLVGFGTLMLFLFVLGAGLPIVSAIVESAHSRKRYGSVVLLVVPLLAFVVLLVTTYLLEAILSPSNHLPAGWRLFLERGVFLGVLIAAILVSTGAWCVAVARSEISQELLRFALLLSIPATISMGVILAAMLGWGLGLHSSVPQLFNSNGGILASSTAFTWLGGVIAMSIMLLMAVVSLVRGFSAGSALWNSIFQHR